MSAVNTEFSVDPWLLAVFAEAGRKYGASVVVLSAKYGSLNCAVLAEGEMQKAQWSHEDTYLGDRAELQKDANRMVNRAVRRIQHNRARRNPNLVGRWFVINRGERRWSFVSRSHWDVSTALIRGERLSDDVFSWYDRHRDETRTFNRKDWPKLTDKGLVADGYILPTWHCGSCTESALTMPRHCPECGTATKAHD